MSGVRRDSRAEKDQAEAKKPPNLGLRPLDASYSKVDAS